MSERVKNLIGGLSNFQMQSELDQKLLLGVFERDDKTKRNKSGANTTKISQMYTEERELEYGTVDQSTVQETNSNLAALNNSHQRKHPRIIR